ncbi:MAG: DUF3667 domain-containing protein [Bacteroidetes bacterium]|nr:DUF3667 domain-containing protein [Bacteroidota bacterium]
MEYNRRRAAFVNPIRLFFFTSFLFLSPWVYGLNQTQIGKNRRFEFTHESPRFSSARFHFKRF